MKKLINATALSLCVVFCVSIVATNPLKLNDKPAIEKKKIEIPRNG